MTEIEQFLAGQKRYRCERLAANITRDQCNQNRSRQPNITKDITKIHACEGCAGLGEEIAMPIPDKRTCIVEGCGKWKVIGDKCTKHAKAPLETKPATIEPKQPKVAPEPPKPETIPAAPVTPSAPKKATGIQMFLLCRAP